MAQVLQGNKELMGLMGDLYFGMLDVPGAEQIAARLKKALPPGLAESEDDGDAPQVQTPRGPVSIEEAGQIIGKLEQANQQATELLQSTEIAKQKAEVQAAANDAAKLDLERQNEAAAQAEAARKLALSEFAEETKRITALVAAAEKGIDPRQISALASLQMEQEEAEDSGEDFVGKAAAAAEAARPQPQPQGGDAAGVPQ
jgi:fused signal recognition particle receptor